MSFLNKLYSFVARPYPSPFTGNVSFQQNTAPPQYDVMGAGRPVHMQFNAFAPQIINTQAVTNEGFGGLFQGQYISQPLLEPNNTP